VASAFFVSSNSRGVVSRGKKIKAPVNKVTSSEGKREESEKRPLLLALSVISANDANQSQKLRPLIAAKPKMSRYKR